MFAKLIRTDTGLGPGNTSASRERCPIRITKDYVCIDMWAASNGFLTWFQFPKVQGQVANDRAAKFEDVVQDLIDRTRWAEPTTRTLRQRTLVIDGQPLTDIDAIGSRDGVLLVVSCKSIPYTREYDRGAHSEVRNAASTVDKAVAYWAGVVEKLDARRVGRNYDFSTFKQIVGVVCTPFEVYTGNAKSLSNTLEGLRWACSLDELANFLDS